MNEVLSILKDVTINADLKTIVKYHPASAVYLNDKTKIEYITTIPLKFSYREIEGEQIFLPDYHYADIADTNLPEEGHDNNILAMVKNLIELEWGYYKTYYVIDETKGTNINLHSHVIKQLEELKVLVTILEQNKVNDVSGQLRLTELKPIEQGKLKRYNVEGIQVEFSDDTEKLEVIRLMANNRIKELSKPEYHFYNFKSEEFTEYSSTQLQKSIDRMALPFRDFRAQWLFCKLVCQTVLNYIKGEMIWNQGEIMITEQQGVFIHSLLCLFNLIDPVQEDKNVTPRDKAKYIRTYFRKDLADKDEAFIEFIKVENETKIKFNDNQWFKVTQ
jgi:hypothetical protein